MFVSEWLRDYTKKKIKKKIGKNGYFIFFMIFFTLIKQKIKYNSYFIN